MNEPWGPRMTQRLVNLCEPSMTAPGALPTREEIIAILSDMRCWCGKTSGAHSHADTHEYQWPGHAVAADALLARLRPAWEAMKQSHATFQRRIDVLENDYKTSADEYRKLWKENDAIRADLRACAEALEDTRASWAGKDGRDLDGLCARCGRAEEQGCNQICAYGEARAALARPGVQATLRSEPKATEP